MKKRNIIFIVCIILMNSLSGCKIRDKEYLMVCEKNEESTYGEVHRVVELYFVNDELILKNVFEEGEYDSNNHEEIVQEINDDYTKYSRFESVKYVANTSNNSSFTKQLTINLGNINEGLLEFFDEEAITKKNKIGYTYEYNQLKEKGYSCKLGELETNDTIIVKSLKIKPLEKIEFLSGGNDIYNGYEIEVTFEPYNVEHWGETNPQLMVWHDQKLYREIYETGPIVNEFLGRVDLPNKGYSSTVAIGNGTETWLNAEYINEEYMITFEDLQEYTERLDEVLITISYNSKTMSSQKVKVTK